MKKLAVFSAIIVCGILLLVFDPTHMILAPKCPFKIITGLNCPACGIQRCIHALLYGHFAEAIHYN